MISDSGGARRPLDITAGLSGANVRQEGRNMAQKRAFPRNLWHPESYATQRRSFQLETTDIALVILDIQAHMFSPDNPVYGGEPLLAKISRLQDKAHRAHVPIVYVQQGRPRPGHPLEVGSGGWQLHPMMVPGTQDAVIQKQMPSAFYRTTLDEYLNAHGIRKLVIAGIQTELCVDTTCREACSRDYDVTLVHDAHSTWTRGGLTGPQIVAHHNALLGDWFVTLAAEQDLFG